MTMRRYERRSARPTCQGSSVFALVISFVVGANLVLADGPTQTTARVDDSPASDIDQPTAQELVKKVYADEAWLGEVDSLLLRIQRVRTYTDEGMKPYEITLGFGQKKTITEPARTLSLNTFMAWDKERVVVDLYLGEYSRSWTTWNGTLGVHSFLRHARDGEPERLSYVLDDKTDRIFRTVLLSQFKWGSVARQMGPKTWWRVLDRHETEETTLPKMAKLIGRETYRGHDCYRVDIDFGHRFYIRISDLRLIANVYVVSPLSPEERFEIKSKVAGRQITGSEWRPWLDTLDEKDRVAAIERCRTEEYKDAIVRIEECFDDYREVAPGCWFPYEQRSYRYTTISKKPVLTNHSETTILDFQVGTELPDEYFEQEIVEGSPVTTDWRYDPPIQYTYSSSQSEEEREKLAAARRIAYEEGGRYLAEAKAAIDKQLGQKPPPLPEEGWIHVEPLTWDDLKGKAVALLFWDVGCGPCHGPLGQIQQGYKNAAEHNGVFIAVHRATDDRSVVEKHLVEQGWTFPVLIDGSGEEGSGASLFEWFGIQGMPWMVTIDKEGRFTAHDLPGISGTTFAQFLELARKPVAESKQPDN